MMKKYLSTVAILSLTTLSAGDFHALGGQSIAMGGAGVASARGSLAGYYNPALLATTKGVDVSLGLGVGVRDNNLGEQIDSLSNSNLTDVVDRIANNAPLGQNTQEDRDAIVEAQNTLKSIADENGIDIMPTAHLAVQYDNFSVGVYLSSDITASLNVDKERTGFSFENEGNYYGYNATTDTYSIVTQDEYEASSLEYALDNNLSTVSAKGLVLTEVPVSYAKAFSLDQGELSVGGSLKFMNGTTYTQTLAVDSKNTNSDTLKENKKESSTVGLDVGLLFKPAQLTNLQIGLVAKNLNSPKFDTADGNSIKVEPQLRTGVLYKVNEDLDMASDLDLIANKTLINGFDTQMFGGGLDYHPVSWFALRGGLMQNLANSNDGLVYTAGLALGFQKFQLDISGQMSSKKGTYDNNDIPKYSRVNVALVSKW